MVLQGIRGSSANKKLVLYALNNIPNLLIDCSNSANPHAFSSDVDDSKFFGVFVVQAESLYRFRDSIRQIPKKN